MAKPNPAQTEKTKPTIDQILDMKKPLELEVEILVHPEYQRRLQELEQKKAEAQRVSRSGKADISQPGTDRIDKEIDKLLEEAADYQVTFKMRDIGRKKLNDLAQKFPPSEEQKRQYKELGAPGVLEYDVDKFGPALLAAVTFEPEITVEAAERIFDEWGAGEVDALFNTAMRVTQGRASVPLSKRGTGAKSNSG